MVEPSNRLSARVAAVVAAMSWKADETKIEYAARLLGAADEAEASDVEELREALRALVDALPDPDKLDFIAEHLDLTDKIWMDVAEKQGNEGARAVFNGVEMQRDLRRWADAARAVLRENREPIE